MELNNNSRWLPQPSEKAQTIDHFLTAVTGVDRMKSISSRTCAECEEKVTVDSFRDDVSFREFHISGMCQTCQDKFFS